MATFLIITTINSTCCGWEVAAISSSRKALENADYMEIFGDPRGDIYADTRWKNARIVSLSVFCRDYMHGRAWMDDPDIYDLVMGDAILL